MEPGPREVIKRPDQKTALEGVKGFMNREMEECETDGGPDAQWKAGSAHEVKHGERREGKQREESMGPTM